MYIILSEILRNIIVQKLTDSLVVIIFLPDLKIGVTISITQFSGKMSGLIQSLEISSRGIIVRSH